MYALYFPPWLTCREGGDVIVVVVQNLRNWVLTCCTGLKETDRDQERASGRMPEQETSAKEREIYITICVNMERGLDGFNIFLLINFVSIP